MSVIKPTKKPKVAKKTLRAKKSHNKNVASKTFVYPNKMCIQCGQKMKRVSATDKHIMTLEHRIRAYAEIYACQNESCELYGKRMKSGEYTNLTFSRYTYGIDVFAKIGVLRFQENKTVTEIQEVLTTSYPHIEVSVRHVENLVKAFMVFLETAKQNFLVVKQKLEKSGIKGLVLSLDGVEPEKGNSILYVVREVQTGEVLLATFLEFSDEKNIKEQIIEPMKKLSEEIDMPIFGWIVDKQAALTNAIKAVFPDAVIQHCQAHFLKEVRKTVREADSKMTKEIKKKIENSFH